MGKHNKGEPVWEAVLRPSSKHCLPNLTLRCTLRVTGSLASMESPAQPPPPPLGEACQSLFGPPSGFPLAAHALLSLFWMGLKQGEPRSLHSRAKATQAGILAPWPASSISMSRKMSGGRQRSSHRAWGGGHIEAALQFAAHSCSFILFYWILCL